MNARDLMSRDVVTVAPDTPLREVAKTLIGHGISAVPVVDAAGALVGMVSEGDLVGRKRTERETRSEWWLMRLAEGEPLSGDFLDHLQSPLAVAREVMSSPVITVSEETRMDDVATLMAAHRVKRVPVLRDGHIVGIVRRADLLRAIGGGLSAPVSRPPDPPANPTAWLDQLDGERAAEVAPGHAAPITALPRDEDLSVDDFLHLVAHHREELNAERARHHAEAAEHRRNDVRRLIDTHVTDKEWNRLLHGAREAAELYLRWERELRPRRFHLIARVLEFPDGVPGDIGHTAPASYEMSRH